MNLRRLKLLARAVFARRRVDRDLDEEPIAYAASLLCVVTACACAALIPAIRAGRIDPVAALRQD
jgi:ABC-type lipoprotein release transport system permease subunit